MKVGGNEFREVEIDFVVLEMFGFLNQFVLLFKEIGRH